MITVQEVENLECKYKVNQSCPTWMNNYLMGNESSGVDWGYWTMSALSSGTSQAFIVHAYGCVEYFVTTVKTVGARAVVVVNKGN